MVRRIGGHSSGSYWNHCTSSIVRFVFCSLIFVAGRAFAADLVHSGVGLGLIETDDYGYDS